MRAFLSNSFRFYFLEISEKRKGRKARDRKNRLGELSAASEFGVVKNASRESITKERAPKNTQRTPLDKLPQLDSQKQLFILGILVFISIHHKCVRMNSVR